MGYSDRLEHEVSKPFELVASFVRVEEDFGSLESFFAKGDNLAVWELVLFLEAHGFTSEGPILLKVFTKG